MVKYNNLRRHVVPVGYLQVNVKYIFVWFLTYQGSILQFPYSLVILSDYYVEAAVAGVR